MRKRMPRWMTAISFGATSRKPNSVWMESAPSCGTMRKSPSEFWNAVSAMDVLHTYTWMAMPAFMLASPLPATVDRPSTQSVGASWGGRGCGNHRIWLGSTTPCPNWAASFDGESEMGTKRLCITAGRMRYSHERSFLARGTVNAVPDSCSAYRPRGCCAEVEVVGARGGRRWKRAIVATPRGPASANQ